MKEWFVIKTHFQQERRANRELLQQRLETLLLLARTEHRNQSGTLIARITPLFSTYLFVKLDWRKSRHQIMATRGVKTFVGYLDGMEKAPVVDPLDIEELKSRVENYVINLSRPHKEIEPGVMVQILFGPFRDQVASVQAIHGSRVEILLQLLGSTTPMTLPRECLQAAA